MKFTIIDTAAPLMILGTPFFRSAKAVLDFGDLMILGMAIPNVLGVFFLTGKVKEKLDEYMELKRSGQM